MFINCPSVLLQVSCVQSLVCYDLNREYVTELRRICYGVKSADWSVYTMNLPNCDAGNSRGGISGWPYGFQLPWG